MIASRKRPGEQVTWADYNALLDMLESLLVVPGNGIQVSRSPRGQMVSATAPSRGGSGVSVPEADGPIVELGHVQGTRDTDTWTANQGHGVRVFLATDIQYSEETGKFEFRPRPAEITESGRFRFIGAEDDPAVLITTTEECKSQPETPA